MQQWCVRLLGVALGSLLLAGCGPTVRLPFLPKSAQDLANGAYKSFSGTKVVRLKGQFTARDPYQVDVTMGRSGDERVSGSGTSGSAPFKLLAVGNKTYIQGQTFWQQQASGDEEETRQARGYGDKWVLARGTSLSQALVPLRDLGGLALRLSADSKRVKKGKETTVGGTRVVPLTDGDATYFVTQSDPIRIVRLESATSPVNLRNLKLDLDYDAKLNAGSLADGQFVDPDDPATLPAFYRLAGSPEFMGCDRDSPGCGLKVNVENEYGKPQGQAVAVLSLLKEDHKTQVGACNAPIPAIDHGQTATVSCQMDGNAWNAFKQSIGDKGTTIYGHAEVKNPPYDA